MVFPFERLIDDQGRKLSTTETYTVGAVPR